MDEIYRSRNLLVRAAHRGGSECVVTFDPHAEDERMTRRAFGQDFFAGHDVAAVHVLCARNHWYHEDDWQEAIAAVRGAVARYARVTTYGSSMGGYGALRFASAIGAQLALALAPQFSIDPRKAPFETRWRKAGKHRWLAELSGPFAGDVPAIVVYDPAMDSERRHVDLIAAEMPVQRLPLPNAGHHVGAYLAECGLLGDLALGAVRGTFDLRALQRLARQRRRRSPHRLIAISIHAYRRSPDLGIAVARRATDLAPDANFAWTNLGILLGRSARWTEAIDAHRRSVACAPQHCLPYIPLAVAHQNAGDLAGALAILRTVDPLIDSADRRLMVWKLRLGIQARLAAMTVIGPALKLARSTRI